MQRMIVLLMVVACGGSSGGGKTSSLASDEATDKTPTAAPDAVAPLVELADITLDESPNRIVYLSVDGAVVGETRRIGTVHMGVLSPDGTWKPEFGRSGRLQADGTYVADGGEVRFRLVEQTLVIDNWNNQKEPLTVTIAPDGTMQGIPGAFVKVKGATTRSLVRTALLVQGLLATAR